MPLIHRCDDLNDSRNREALEMVRKESMQARQNAYTVEKPRERDLSDEGKRRAVKWSVSSFNGSNG
ncbi:hypothetical protein AAVH_22739 [Aphelenchoides avenae]|nr:hypothetical protein AAVH_22739 [Aphelenchus avenae]